MSDRKTSGEEHSTSDTIGGRLGTEEREEAWRRLESETFDLVVIGGGVVGAGTALDAATRGLRVALVEARDLASGTSSRSSKLFHGGLRYLEQLEFGLVREALRERELMLTRIAPHLVKPVSFLYPLTHRGWERPYTAAGLFMYDSMGGARSVPGQKHLTRAGALRMAPALKRSSLIGGIRYFDAQADDARHTMTVARTAMHYGAVVRTSTQVVGFLREADRVSGVRIHDVENGRETEVQANAVINCTGVWTDELQRLSGSRGRFRVRASKGVHIVVPRDRIVSETGLILRTEKSVLFVIPWRNHWIVGHDGHGLEPRPGAPVGHQARHRLPPRPRQLGARDPADARRHRGRVRGAAAAAGRGVGGDVEAVPRARGRPGVAGPDRDRGRQVHDVPGDGRGRRRRRVAGPAGPAAAVDHRQGAAARRGRLPRAGQPGRPAGRPARAAPVPGPAPARPVRLARARGAGAGRGPPGAAAAAAVGAGLPAGGDRVRGLARGCAARGGHAVPAHADLDRVPAPGRGLRRRRWPS